MEIDKFKLEYRKHSPKVFYDWLSQGKVMEIRFLSDYLGNKFKNWNLIKNLANSIKCEYRFNSLYITSYQQLQTILLYKLANKYILTKYYNIFIGVNPRRKVYVKSKNGLIYKSYYGGIAGIECVQNILCDIEHINRTNTNATEAELEECIQGAEYLIKILKLRSAYINISGNGTHLWFNLENPISLPIPEFIELEDKLKYKLKKLPIVTYIKTYNRFIEKLNKQLKKFNPKLKVDEGAKDLSRVARPPGSWNVKKNIRQRCCGTVRIYKNNINIINKIYMAAAPLVNKDNRTIIKRAKNSSNNRYNELNIAECPLYKLLVSQFLPSDLSRNHYLEQSFAKILRDNNISLDKISDLIDKIDGVQNKSIQVDPDYLDDDSPFNSEMVNSYCVGNKIDLVYPLLEDYPNVQDNYISNTTYEMWNDYSFKTIIKLISTMPNIEVNSYLGLKKEIRALVDIHPKMEVFFIMKKNLFTDWEYYHKNKIILQLLNKTRKKNNG